MNRFKEAITLCPCINYIDKKQNDHAFSFTFQQIEAGCASLSEASKPWSDPKPKEAALAKSSPCAAWLFDVLMVGCCCWKSIVSTPSYHHALRRPAIFMNWAANNFGCYVLTKLEHFVQWLCFPVWYTNSTMDLKISWQSYHDRGGGFLDETCL